MDVAQYYLQKRREFERYSAWPNDDFVCEKLEGSDGKRGTIQGTVPLGVNAYVHVFELVVISAKTPTRRA